MDCHAGLNRVWLIAAFFWGGGWLGQRGAYLGDHHHHHQVIITILILILVFRCMWGFRGCRCMWGFRGCRKTWVVCFVWVGGWVGMATL